MGNSERAASHYRDALSHNRDLPVAHAGLASLRLPGDNFCVWLERLYSSLAPETLIELGIGEGRALARPPTMVIGVDPKPIVVGPAQAETHLFAETSDAFFARRGPDALLAGRRLGIGLIDGAHLFEQTLKDFINLERYCGPRSVILLRNTIPLDEVTQRRTRETQFYTGDVWKAVLCLKAYRPSLDIFTVATPWTGLTVVTGLDPGSYELAERYDEAVARFVATPYAQLEGNIEIALNVVANDWNIVEARLRGRGLL